MKDNKQEITSIIAIGMIFNALGVLWLVIGISQDENLILMSLGVPMIIAGAVFQGIAIGKSRKSKK